MKKITNILLVLVLLLTGYNTYKIYSAEQVNNTALAEKIELNSKKIDVNAKEILNGVGNIKTIADFVNGKFESYHPSKK